MKSKIYLLLLFVFVFGGHLMAQNQNALLWKISGNGLSEPSYIFGTVHIMCPEDFSMKQSVKEAFSRTGQVYLELDFDDPNMETEMQKGLMLSGGETAEDYLNGQEYQLLDSFYLAKLNVGMMALKAMKPLMLMSVSYMALLQCEPKSFEKEFVQMAKAENKEVFGLETVGYQIGVFDSIPIKKQYQMVLDLVQNIKESLEEFDSMLALYEKQDINGLRHLVEESKFESFKGYTDILLDNRNINWASQFEAISKEKPTFFAVGAAHLAGEHGWLKLLKKKGYKVGPVLGD